MCIIVAKPTGIDIPTEKIFDNCFMSNRDGIGFAFNLPGETVTISKGFANVKKLLRMIETFNITKEHNLIVHFRLATHGKKDEGNCHPFPLTNDFEDMRELHCACQTAIAHNGVFGGMKDSQNYSDTMKFIGGILAFEAVISNLDSKPIQELIRGYCGYSSKLAFLRPAGLTTVGQFEQDDGVYYSNTQYKSWGSKNHNHHCNGWKEGTMYCYEHQVYDKCHKEKIGMEYCYEHKKWDNCEWCKDHRMMDDCAWLNQIKIGFESKALVDVHGNKLLDLRKITTCEWCGTKDDVLFADDLQANVCGACKVLYVKGYH